MRLFFAGGKFAREDDLERAFAELDWRRFVRAAVSDREVVVHQTVQTIALPIQLFLKSDHPR